MRQIFHRYCVSLSFSFEESFTLFSPIIFDIWLPLVLSVNILSCLCFVYKYADKIIWHREEFTVTLKLSLEFSSLRNRDWKMWLKDWEGVFPIVHLIFNLLSVKSPVSEVPKGAFSSLFPTWFYLRQWQLDRSCKDECECFINPKWNENPGLHVISW